MSVFDLYQRNLSQRPEAISVVDADVTLTWTDLDQVVRRAHAWLDLYGVRPGDRVVYSAAPDYRMIAMFWAAMRHGAILVPLHHDLRGAQVGRVVSDSQAAVAVVGEAQLSGLAQHEGTVLEANHLWRTINGIDPEAAAAPAPIAEDATALLMYTSGTTGRPKGIICPHGTVALATASINACLGYTATDVVLCRLPLSFDYGLYQVLLCAESGAALVLAERERDLSLIDLMVRHGVTVVPLVPSLAQMLTVLRRRTAAHTSVRLFTNTGARLSAPTMAALLEHFPDASYASMYGMTECKRIAILPPREYRTHPDSVGYAIPGNVITICDRDGRQLEHGTPGEIVVRGRTVMAGYWGVDLADQARYRQCPDGAMELRTGDQGWLDADGRLYFLGRDDDIVKRNGIRLSLHEIEDAAGEVNGVDAAIALRPEPEDGPLILAVTGRADLADVTRHLGAVLDRSRRPSRVVKIAAVPLTHNGKPDRTATRALIAGAGVLTPASSAEPAKQPSVATLVAASAAGGLR